MVKDAYILMDEDREELIQVVTATQVANAKLYNNILKENALWAKYMMDKFKEFLSNDNITSLERRSLLMKFLMEQTQYDVIHQVLEYIDTCELKDDYSVIVMEWTLHNSQNITEELLDTCDGLDLLQPIYKNTKERLILPKVSEEDDVKAIVEVKVVSLEDKKKLEDTHTDGLNLLISEILKEEGIDNVNGTASDGTDEENQDDK